MAVIALCIQYVFLPETVPHTSLHQGKKFCLEALTDWTWTKSGYLLSQGQADQRLISKSICAKVIVRIRVWVISQLIWPVVYKILMGTF